MVVFFCKRRFLDRMIGCSSSKGELWKLSSKEEEEVDDLEVAVPSEEEVTEGEEDLEALPIPMLRVTRRRFLRRRRGAFTWCRFPGPGPVLLPV